MSKYRLTKEPPLKELHDRIVVLGVEECDACRTVKRELESSGGSGVKYLDARRDELGKALAEALEIEEYPAILAVSREGNKTVICVVDEKTLEPKDCYEIESADE